MNTFAKAFNQWMDDYTKNPEAYSKIEQESVAFLRERLSGKEPSYGERCAAIFSAYLTQLA